MFAADMAEVKKINSDGNNDKCMWKPYVAIGGYCIE